MTGREASQGDREIPCTENTVRTGKQQERSRSRFSPAAMFPAAREGYVAMNAFISGRSPIVHRTIGPILRLAIGAVFIASGTLKLLDPAAFAWNIYQYGLVPRLLIDPIAVGLPVMEVAAGAGLVLNRRWSYGAVGGMLMLFMALLGYAIINGLNVDCGCFGAGDPGPAGLRNAFLRDVIMTTGLAAAWWFRDDSSVQARTAIRNTIISKEDAS